MGNETHEKLARAIWLLEQIEQRKAFYAELDQIILALQADGWLAGEVAGIKLELVDNFASGKNTVFRPAGVHRWEIRKVKGS